MEKLRKISDRTGNRRYDSNEVSVRVTLKLEAALHTRGDNLKQLKVLRKVRGTLTRMIRVGHETHGGKRKKKYYLVQVELRRDKI
jgi:hypothetical protein